MKRYTTYETVESNPMFVTNTDNEREPFKLEKLYEKEMVELQKVAALTKEEAMEYLNRLREL